MADQTIALASAEKQFSFGVGICKFAVATMASGSDAKCILPQGINDVAVISVLNAGVAVSNFSWAIAAQTVNSVTKEVTPAYAMVTAGAGGIANGAQVVAVVVM